MPGFLSPSTCPSTIAGPTSPGTGESLYQAACIGWCTDGTEIEPSVLTATARRLDSAPILGILTVVGRSPLNGAVTGTEAGTGAGAALGASGVLQAASVRTSARAAPARRSVTWPYRRSRFRPRPWARP